MLLFHNLYLYMTAFLFGSSYGTYISVIFDYLPNPGRTALAGPKISSDKMDP